MWLKNRIAATAGAATAKIATAVHTGRARLEQYANEAKKSFAHERNADLTAGELAAQLEASAAVSADRLSCWALWNALLAGPQRNELAPDVVNRLYADVSSKAEIEGSSAELLTWKQVFLRSHAVELTVAGVAECPPDEEQYTGKDAPVPTWWGPLIELMKHALVGETEDHERLLHELLAVAKASAESPESKCRTELLRDAVMGLVAVYKQDWRLEAQFRKITTLQDRLENESKVASAEEPKGEQADRTTLALIDLHKQLRVALMGCQDGLKSTGHKNEAESHQRRINEQFAKTTAELEKKKTDQHDQQKKIITQQEEAVSFQNKKRANYERDVGDVSREISSLQARKKQLEDELAEVESNLGKAKTKQKRLEDDFAVFSDTYGEMLGSLAMQESDLGAGIEATASDLRLTKQLYAFVEQKIENIGALLEKQKASIEKHIEKESCAYLSVLEKALRASNEALNKHRRLLSFCAEELKKRKQLEEEGVAEINELVTSNEVILKKREQAVLASNKLNDDVRGLIMDFEAFYGTVSDEVKLQATFLELNEKIMALITSYKSISGEIAALTPSQIVVATPSPAGDFEERKNQPPAPPTPSKEAAATLASGTSLPTLPPLTKPDKPGVKVPEAKPASAGDPQESSALAGAAAATTIAAAVADSKKAEAADSKPAGPKPAETVIADSKPAILKPTETKAEAASESKPVAAKSAETAIADSKPASPKPAETKAEAASESKPAAAKPTEAKAEAASDDGAEDKNKKREERLRLLKEEQMQRAKEEAEKRAKAATEKAREKAKGKEKPGDNPDPLQE